MMVSERVSRQDFTAMAISGSIKSDLEDPLKPLHVEFTEEDMREIAYEIVIAACGPAVSARTTLGVRSTSISSPRYHDKSLTSAAASRVKKALGLKSRSSKDLYNSTSGRRKYTTPTDILRLQFDVSDDFDAHTRKALSRAAASQAGRRSDAMVVPLELLQHISASDFPYNAQYQLWHKRQVKVLDAGLILHSAIQDVPNSLTVRLKQALQAVHDHPMESGKNSEVLQALRSAALAKAGRSLTGDVSSNECHWADGFPFNVHIYETMLSACFDTLDNTVVIDEIDDILELVKRTWSILGLDQLAHDVLFMWVLFRQFVITGQNQLELLEAAALQMSDVGKSVALTKLSGYHNQLLSSILSTVQAWCEKRLLAYREAFPAGSGGLLEHTVSVATAAAKILSDITFKEQHRRPRKDELNVVMSRIDMYIRSTLRTAFAQMMESVDAKRRSSKEGTPSPALVVLAEDIERLAVSERDEFSPILKIWHPFPAGVAAATLHACYGREFKQFLSKTAFPTPDAVQVLSAADNLEKELITIAVGDALFSEDGGKAIIREMPPYEADTAIKSMAEKWIQDRLDRLVEWVDRSGQQEDWNPRAVREKYAPSVVEVLRIVEETLDAYFSMPLASFPDLLDKLVAGVDRALASYATQAVTACGTKSEMIPPLPALTRCKKEHFRLSVKFVSRKNKVPVEPIDGTHNSREVEGNLERMCVRINTLHHLQSELEFIEKRVRYGWQEAPSSLRKQGKGSAPPPSKAGAEIRFEASRRSLQDGIQRLCEISAYRIVFVDMRKVFWEGLYVGGVENSRVSRVIDKLDPILGILADTVTKGLRNKAVVELMRACFEGFLLVLLAGGPSRTFTVGDADMLEEDLTSFKDLFKADGDGLSEDMVENVALPVVRILSLFSVDTEELIENFKAANSQYSQGKGSKGVPPPLPSTIQQFSPSDANTVLRVLCYRADDRASNFLKKTYNLPKKL